MKNLIITEKHLILHYLQLVVHICLYFWSSLSYIDLYKDNQRGLKLHLERQLERYVC